MASAFDVLKELRSLRRKEIIPQHDISAGAILSDAACHTVIQVWEEAVEEELFAPSSTTVLNLHPYYLTASISEPIILSVQLGEGL
jgi:hypothetical protein